LEVTAEGRLVC